MVKELYDKHYEQKEGEEVSQPRYFQIALDIAMKIARGEFKENEKLFGRSLLATRYAVSPETIRRSMRILADVGIIEVKSKSGSLVLSRNKAIEFVENYNIGRSVHTLKRELRTILQEQNVINKKTLDIISEIIHINEHLKNSDPLRNYEIEIPEDSHIIGKSIEELKFWQNTGATIVAIRKPDRLILSPGPYAGFDTGDSLVVVGDVSTVDRVKNFIGG